MTFHLLFFSSLSFHPERSLPLNGKIGLGAAEGESDHRANVTATAGSIRRNMVTLGKGGCGGNRRGENATRGRAERRAARRQPAGASRRRAAPQALTLSRFGATPCRPCRGP